MAVPLLRSAAGPSLLPAASRRLAVSSCASQRLALRTASHLASSRGHAAASLLRPPPRPLPRLFVRCYATPAEPPRSSQQGESSSPGPSASAGQPSRAAMAEAARKAAYRKRNQSLLLYTAATFIFGIGVTYAAVPLYRAFCASTGFSGTPMVGTGRFSPEHLIPRWLDPRTGEETRRIRVTFNADASDALPWGFEPSQNEVYVLPGETALAFYKAKNTGPADITGIATYNVAPDKIAPYFAKVECFCFEEQRLLAGEEVDLPVFFFIDADVLDDPSARDVRDVVLSYTFFGARRNEKNGQLEPDTDLSKYTVGKDL